MKLSRLSQTLAIISAFVIFPSVQAQQVLPFYEPFPAAYTNGGTLQIVNGVEDIGRYTHLAPARETWSLNGSSGDSGNPVAHRGAALTYPGLWTTPEPNVGMFITNATGGNRNTGVPFTNVTSNKLYASFLLNILTAPTANRQVAYLGSNPLQFTSTMGNVHSIFLTASSELRLGKNTSSAPSSDLSPALTTGATNLVVVRYTFITNDVIDDEFALWLNPSQGSLGAAEANVPVPNLTITNGSDFTNLSGFYFAQRNNSSTAGVNMLIDEVRIGTSWAHVTPTNEICVSAVIVNSPTNRTTPAGITGQFAVAAGGTGRTYQWQVSTDNGTNWNNINNATGSSYITPNTTLPDSGKQYRVVVAASCDSSSVTSGVATLTVAAPIISPLGLVVDDFWLDGDRISGPVATNNAMWVASLGGSLFADIGAMLGYPGEGTSRLWVGYFTDAVTNLPVHLDIGRTLKTTLVFSPSGSAIVNGGNALRFGLFDYADGGVRLTTDDFGSGSTGNGVGVRGYMMTMAWGTSFTNNTPIEIYVRGNLTDNNLLGSTAAYTSLGVGPIGGTYNGSNAFQNDVTYTLEFSVARTGQGSASISANLTGGGLNISFTTNDNTYAYPRFDAFAIRPTSKETTFETIDGRFVFTEFKAEVVTNSIVAPPDRIPLNTQLNGSNVILTWTNSAFALQAAPVVTGTYTNVPGATSPYTNAISESRKFFRLIAQ